MCSVERGLAKGKPTLARKPHVHSYKGVRENFRLVKLFRRGEPKSVYDGCRKFPQGTSRLPKRSFPCGHCSLVKTAKNARPRSQERGSEGHSLTGSEVHIAVQVVCRVRTYIVDVVRAAGVGWKLPP